MTIKFCNHEELIKGIVLGKIKNETIIHVGSKKEMTIKDILKMRLVDIQKLEKFAIC